MVVLPLGVTPGTTNKIKIRGLNLTNVSEVRFSDTNLHADVIIKSKGKADVPKESDVKTVGDTQLELELKLPSTAPVGTNSFTLISPDGESPAYSLITVPAGSLLAEKEPNGSFREAQPLEFGKTVQGSIHEAKDVDVFRLSGHAGQTIVAEVRAARSGAALDSILTVYDEHGHVLATNDDTDEAGNDSILRVRFPADGVYFLSLIDAHDKGGPTHVYLLTVKPE